MSVAGGFLSLLGFMCLAGCTRASVASLLPSLQLGVAARRSASAAAGGATRAGEVWDTVALLRLQFQPRTVARELPVRGELAPETWLAPCDADDVICLQEASDAEAELRAAFGELQ